MHNPVVLAAAFMLGLALAAAYQPGWAGTTLALGCLAVGLAGAAAGGLQVSRRVELLTAALLVFAALGTGLCLRPALAANNTLPPAGVARIEGWVQETRFGRDGQARSRIRVTQGARLVDSAPIAAGTELWAGPIPLPEGARLRLLATLSPHVPFRNPSPHPPLPNTHPTQGSAKLAAADAYRVLEHPWPARWLDGVRVRLRRALEATLPVDVSEVARALILGDPDTLSDDDATSVRRSGMAHVFAVSGMHVTLLAGLGVLLLTRVLLLWPALARRYEARRIAVALGIPWALAIAALTGGAPSGWRASITTALCWLLVACGLRPNAAAVSAFACLGFGAVQPSEAMRPAFLLSIAATAAIVAAPHSPARDLQSLWLGALGLSARTSLATAPIVLWTFGSVPIVGVFANLLLVPVGSGLLVLAALHALLAVVVPPLAALSGAPLILFSRAFLQACGAFAQLAPGVTWPPPDVCQGATLVLGVCACLYCKRWRSLCWVVLAMLGLLLVLEWRLRHAEQPTGMLRATFLDVGQGDAALVDLPDGRCMLIDAGGNPNGGADPGSAVLLPLLRARRRDHLDLVVLSHPHPDHYGGLAALVGQVPVTELWDNGQASAEGDLAGTSRAATQLMAALQAHGTRVLRPSELCQKPRVFGGALLQVLAPCPSYDPGYDANDNSLVVRIQYGRRALLFAGDIEAHTEQALVGSGVRVRADVLKVPHHGSRTSSSPELLRAVAPELAIVSAGAVNPFGHPHAEVMTRLRSSVARVIDLGTSGGVTVTTDGSELRVSRW